MSFPSTLPVVVNVKPNGCNEVLGDDVCAILDQIDVAFKDLDALSTEIAKNVDDLLTERETKVAEQNALIAEGRQLFLEKEALTNSLKEIQDRGDAAALQDANTQLVDVTQNLEQVNAELTQANADLAQNALDIERLRAELAQTRAFAVSTFKGVQNNLASTGGRLFNAVNKKRKLDSLPVFPEPQWMAPASRATVAAIGFNANGGLIEYGNVPNRSEIQANNANDVYTILDAFHTGQRQDTTGLSKYAPVFQDATKMNLAFGIPMETLQSEPLLQVPIDPGNFYEYLKRVRTAPPVAPNSMVV